MHGHAGAHAPLFVLMSVAVAVLGSWAALDMFRRVRANSGASGARWLAATAVAFGLSIWSMHFIAMLGWDPGVPVSYDLGLTALSLVLPILASGAGFFIATVLRLRWFGVAVTGLVMGAAICAMHYVGMAAVQGPLYLAYSPLLVAASYAVASAAATGGLWAAQREASLPGRVLAAVVLGLSIVGMHYTGMAALRVTIEPGAAPSPGGITRLVLAGSVASSTFFLLLMALVATKFDRSREALMLREAAALRRSERQLRSILEQMPFGTIVAEAPSGAIRFGNAQAERLLGHALIPALSLQDYAQYGSLEPGGESRRSEDYALARAIRGVRVERERQLYRRGDGSVVTLEVSAAPVRNEEGEIELGVVAFHDITAAVRAEEGLRRTQRLEAVGQLTGGVAHDFNNLLTAVIGSVTLALKRAEDSKLKELLHNALHGAQRGAKLTSQLLAFSRRQRLETRPVDVNAMVEGMGGLLSSTLGPSVKVHFELAESLPAATADPTQLELAVLNLAINARDAMPDGGMLTIATSHEVVDQPGEAHEPDPGEYVAVCVQDDGVGMPPDVLAHAFEPFFTTKPVGKGSGLGLSQVLGLAKQMGGGVKVETAPGQGTKVSVFLSKAEQAAETERPAPPIVEPAGKAGATVLVVDDDDDVRRYVCELLRDAGFDVESAGGGAEGVDRIRAGLQPDLVLMDFAMPEMNGLEASRRTEAARPGTPVLIMTGYADLDALPAGLDRRRLLQKPFAPDELIERIGGLLRPEQAAS